MDAEDGRNNGGKNNMDTEAAPAYRWACGRIDAPVGCRSACELRHPSVRCPMPAFAAQVEAAMNCHVL